MFLLCKHLIDDFRLNNIQPVGNKMQIHVSKKQIPATKVFVKTCLNNETSTMFRLWHRFGFDVQCSALVHNFNNIFQLDVCNGLGNQ